MSESLKDLTYSIEFNSIGLDTILKSEQKIDKQIEGIAKATIEVEQNNNKVANGIENIKKYSSDVDNTWKKIDGKFIKVKNTSKETETQIDKIKETVIKTDESLNKTNTTAKKGIGIFKRMKNYVNTMFDGFKKGKQTFNNGIEDIKKQQEKINKGTNKTKSAMGGLGKTIAGVFAAKKIVDFGKSTIETYADFEQGMANVHATMGNITNDQFEDLTKAAREAGQDTIFSAKEAAEAENYLALSGMKVNEITEAMPKVLNLASAGNLDLGRAADIATDGLSACGLKVKDLDGFMDKMAKSAQKSNTDIDQIGQAIITVGGVAKDANMSISDMDTALGLLANSGKKGAEGGTALRNVLLNLTANEKAAKLMKEMGVKTADATGKIRPLNSILVDLKKSLGKETQATQQFIKGVIGGKENIQALNILLEGSGDQYNNLKKEILDSKGASEEMANVQKNTVKGAMKTLESAMQELQISFFDGKQGSEGLKDGLNKLAKNVLGCKDKFKDLGTKIVGVFNWVLEHQDTIISDFEHILGAIMAFKAIQTIIDLYHTWKEATELMKLAQIGLNLALKDNPVGIVITIIGLLVIALIELCRHSEKCRQFMCDMWEGMKSSSQSCLNWIINRLNDLIDLINHIPLIKIPHIPNVGNKDSGGYKPNLQYEKPLAYNQKKVDKNKINTNLVEGTKLNFFADGGIVTKPTNAVVGEGGETEGIFPLSKLEDFLSKRENKAQLDILKKANIKTEPTIIINTPKDNVNTFREVINNTKENNTIYKGEKNNKFKDSILATLKDISTKDNIANNVTNNKEILKENTVYKPENIATIPLATEIHSSPREQVPIQNIVNNANTTNNNTTNTQANKVPIQLKMPDIIININGTQDADTTSKMVENKVKEVINDFFETINAKMGYIDVLPSN